MYEQHDIVDICVVKHSIGIFLKSFSQQRAGFS